MPSITLYLTEEEKKWAEAAGDSRSGRIRQLIQEQMEEDA